MIILVTASSNTHFSMLFFCQVVAKKLQSALLSPFVSTLLEGLTDGQSHSASGSCVVLNSIVRIRGQEIRKDVSFQRPLVRVQNESHS